MGTPACSDTPCSFETALSQLEGIVQDMENGQLNLEDSLSAYQRGMGLLKFCQDTLNSAERKIAILEGKELQDYPSQGEQHE